VRVSYAVVGHHTRREAAEKLVARLGCPLAMDEGDRGSLPNHDAAWRLGHALGGDYVVVLEDDVVLIDDFETHVVDALSNVPQRAAVSFYTGTTRPHPDRVRRAVVRATQRGRAWLEARRAYWGPALALPREHVEPMLRFVRPITLPYDQRLSRYLVEARLLCFYTNPSLVDHADWPSLLSRDDEPRRAHRVGVPESWATRAVNI